MHRVKVTDSSRPDGVFSFKQLPGFLPEFLFEIPGLTRHFTDEKQRKKIDKLSINRNTEPRTRKNLKGKRK